MRNMAEGFWSMFEKRLERVVLTVCKLFLLVQVLVVSYVVFGRFVLNKTPGWGEELALLCMVWFSMLSIGLGIKSDSHIRMNLYENLIPKRFRALLEYVWFAFDIGLALVLIVAGWQMAALAGFSTLSGMGVSSMYLYASVPAGGAFMLMAIVLRKLRERRSADV